MALLVLLVSSGFGVGLVSAQNQAGVATSPIASESPSSSHSTNGGITVCGKGVTRTLTSPTGSLGIGGNITVCNGGSLTIKGVTVSIQSYTGTNNFWLAGDLNFRYHVNVTGGASLHLVDAVLNTSANSFDSYPRLNVTVANSSTLTLDKSSLSFAGTVWVTSKSTLFLNSSSLTPNKALPIGPASFVQDSTYSPTLTVTSGSTLVTNNATITNYYKNPASSTPALDETLVTTSSASVVNNTLLGSGVSTNVSSLLTDTYDRWSQVNLQFTVNANANFTATVNFTAYGSSITLANPYTFSTGTNTITVTLNPSYVENILNQHGLSGLVGGLQAGTIGLVFSGISIHNPGKFLSLQLTLTPDFRFDVSFSGSSHLYALDSLFDVNWVNATGVPAWESNKVLLQGGSTGDLLNTSALTTYNNAVTNGTEVNSFLVDPTSSYVVYDWVKVKAVGASGSPVPGAALSFYSEVSDPAVASEANYDSNPAHFPALFYAAVCSVAVSAGSPCNSYGNTSSIGIAHYALATTFVYTNSLPDGLYADLYNLSFSETVGQIDGGLPKVVNGIAAQDTPLLCWWPYYSLTCASTVIPTTVLPLYTANMQVESLTVAPVSGGNCPSGCSLYEGTSLEINVTISDSQNLYQIAGNAAIPVYVYNVTASTNVSSTPQYLTNGDFLSSTAFTLNFYLTVPFHISQPPYPHFWVAIDPLHVAPENGTIAKNASFAYTAIPAPFVGTPTLQVNDGCTSQQLSIPYSNSCNLIEFVAAIANTGDAKVNVSVIFSWNGTTQIGATHYMNLDVGTPVIVSQSLLLNYGFKTGSASVQVFSPASSGGPSIDVGASTPSLYFVDFTSLSLPTNHTTFSIVVPGGPGPTPTDNQTALFAIGDAIGVTLNLTNVGSAGNGGLATLDLLQTGNTGTYWQGLENQSITIPAATTGPISVPVSLFWHVNATKIGSVVGVRHFMVSLSYTNSWLYGRTAYTFNSTFNATIAPPKVSMSGFYFTPVTIIVGGAGTPETLAASGTVFYESTPALTALVSIYMFSQSSGVRCEVLSSNPLQNGSTLPSFSVGASPATQDNAGILAQCLGTGKFNLDFEISYLGKNTWFNSTGAITLNQPTTTSSFFGSIYFLLLLVVIAVAIVVAVLFLLKKFGKGNLVECGECGELIPETAVACPKCGAEFEKGMVRCSRCGSSIPSNNKSCPECSVLLVGHEPEPNAAAYTKFADRYRVVGKKELGENYNEGAFWDWWKRQPTYLSFSAWSQQQEPAVRGTAPGDVPTAQQMADAGHFAPPPMPHSGAPASQVQPGASSPGPSSQSPEAPPAQPGLMKVCPSCGKGINDMFLLCPFCGAVTR